MIKKISYLLLSIFIGIILIPSIKVYAASGLSLPDNELITWNSTTTYSYEVGYNNTGSYTNTTTAYDMNMVSSISAEVYDIWSNNSGIAEVTYTVVDANTNTKLDIQTFDYTGSGHPNPSIAQTQKTTFITNIKGLKQNGKDVSNVYISINYVVKNFGGISLKNVVCERLKEPEISTNLM